jgi:hypothetical protein
MRARSIGVVARGSTTLVNLDPEDRAVRVIPGPDTGDFEYPAGDFTLPDNGQLPLRVTFFGATAPGVFRSSMTVVAAGRTLTVPITAAVTQVGPSL